MMEEVSFWVRPPASSKNRRQLVTKSRRPLSLPSKLASNSIKEIRETFLAQIKSLTIPWPDEEISIDVNYWVQDDAVQIRVKPLGPRPKVKKTGRKRDLHGMIETICDALQGVAFSNDNQVAMVTMQRIVE